MSDHDAEHDPIDAAYAEAEAMLSDEAARAARRAKVLAAVASAPAAAPSSPMRRPAWQSRGWLAAASIVGVGVLVATQLYQPPHRPAPDIAAPAPVAAFAPRPNPPPSEPALRKPLAPPMVRVLPNQVPTSVTPPPLALPPAPQAFPNAPPVYAPAPAPPPPPPPPPPAPEADAGVTESVVVTAAKRAETAPRPAPPPADPAAILRQAAAMGRTGDIKALLTKGALVDAADEAGTTALMQAVQADQAAAVALLVRHGADPDRRNTAGQSARDIAAKVADPALDKALASAP